MRKVFAGGYFAVFLSVFSSLSLASAISLDFCAHDLLPASAAAGSLRFTKELNTWEFAVDSEFKSLHCCAKGYLSIEWFKDGRPYPWPSDVSSFILYPEAANQTVYTKVLSVSDAGNYTCRIHNDTSDMSHTMQLKVFDSGGYMENPLATYEPPSTSYANLGQSTRLFCEAFVGRIDLPDANNEVMWVKEGSALQSPHATVEITARDRGQIVGAYLTIRDIEESDFGSYSCFISNTGDQQIVMTTQLRAYDSGDDDFCIYDKAMLLLMMFLVVLCLSLLVFSRQTRADDSPVRLFFRKVVEISHNMRKGPTAGVIVLYSDGDEAFVNQKFVPALRRHSTYCPFPLKVSKQWGVSEESRELCKRVGRVVIVLSNQVTPSWTREAINESLKQMMTMDAQYCVVLTQPLPYTLDEGNKFFQDLRTFSLVPWKDDAFTGDQVIFGCDRLTANNSVSSTKPHRLISRFFPVNLTSAEVQV